VWDDAIEGSDSIVIGRILAAVAKKEAPDMVFAGVQSSDQAYAATGISTAAYLNWPHAAVVADLQYQPGSNSAVIRRELEGGMLQQVSINCPAVLTIQLGINKPRYASLRGIKQAASKPIEEMSLVDMGLSAADVGVGNSMSRVRRMYIPAKGRAQMIEGTVAEQAARLIEIMNELKGT
jgi:electron transfer flavoprotein beta subunit